MGNGPRTPDSKGNQVPTTHRTRDNITAAICVISLGGFVGAIAWLIDIVY